MNVVGRDSSLYYDARAGEYESIYDKPERRPDLEYLERFLSEAFVRQDVLELACGTGYWTQFIARSARSIVAVDVNESVLDIARKKEYGMCPVSFVRGDAYSLKDLTISPSAGFHAFWWSHIPRQDIQQFLQSFHGRLQDRTRVTMLDNRYVEGNSTPISKTDEFGNTYQMRMLKDGTCYQVLKNFPTVNDLRIELADVSALKVTDLQYYWLAEYVLT